MQGELAAIGHRIEARLSEKITQAIGAGETAAETDADALAGHIMAVIQGMSTLARDGATREKLLRVAATAIEGWPKPPATCFRAR